MLPNVVGEDPSLDGTISFQPNVIPFLEIHLVGKEFFNFEWYNNTFDLKLLICMTDGKNHTLGDFWEATGRTVKWKILRDKATESMYEFGYMIEDIPREIADNVEFLVWKIDGASFDVDKIEVEEIEVFEEGYNITRFHLPNNLVLSYEDLWLYDFMISHPNKQETIVKGVKGETAWNLDPIVFSGGVITITDYDTEGSACDHNDIYNAMLNSTFQKQGDNQYYSNAKIVIGNGTGSTWFVDSGVQVSFNSSCVTANYQVLYIVQANARFRLGELADANSKTGKNGVSIRDENTAYTIYFIYASTSAYVELYGSYFYAGKASTYLFLNGANHKVYECVIDHCSPYLMSVDVENLHTKVNSYGLYRPVGTKYNDINMHDSGYGIYFYTNDVGDVKNVVARNNTYLITCRNIAQNHHVINVDSDSWNIAWSGTSIAEVYRQYTFDLTVSYPNGTAIQNANVTVSYYGQGETEDFTELTDSNGQITQKTLTMGFYNQTGGNTIYSYNPHNITVTYSGMQTYTKNFTLDEKTVWIIALQEEPSADYNWFAATIIIGIFACFMVIYALTTKN